MHFYMKLCYKYEITFQVLRIVQHGDRMVSRFLRGGGCHRASKGLIQRGVAYFLQCGYAGKICWVNL